MITRFYVDNYKCLVNFEYKPQTFELIIGANGSGKTTVFEALNSVQNFILNQEPIDKIFPNKDLTRWQTRETMQFELEITYGEEDFRYELNIDLEDPFTSNVKTECLWINETKYFESNYKVDRLEDAGGQYAYQYFMEVVVYAGQRHFAFRVSDTDKSALGQYAPNFRKALESNFFVKLQPSAILPSVKSSQRRPTQTFSNFAAYYLHLLQEKQGLIFDLLPILRENVEGFRAFVIEELDSGTRKLRVEFAVEGGKKGQAVRYDFRELSDGQRALIALYTLAFCESNSTLLIDEPENYISVRELQPWLMLLRERIEDFGGQAILISHHPEFINVMAPQDAIQFRRKDGGPVMIRPFETKQFQGLTPAEIVARGWENE